MRTQLIALLVLGACGVEEDAPPTTSDPNDAVDGETAYLENCASCHGTDGAGTADAPSILNSVAGYATYVVRNGRAAQMGYATGMDAIGAEALPDADLDKIIAWLDSATKPTTGPELYVRFCANCHGSNGRSGRVAKNIVRNVGELNDLVRSGHGGHFYSARTSYMPSWSSSEITDAELSLIRAYVSQL